MTAAAPQVAAVIGAGGGLGGALLAALEAGSPYDRVIGLGRHTDPPLDLLAEPSIAAAAAWLAGAGELRLVLDATGFLHGAGFTPERGLRALDPAHMAHSYALNAIGPALLMKHLCPLLPRRGRSVFATLSARVGSIGDNRLGGWHSYRAAKAALNQLVRTASIEVARTHPDAILAALHPGTVGTPLSAPFAKSGLDVRPPGAAATDLLGVIARLRPQDSGGFYDQTGAEIPW